MRKTPYFLLISLFTAFNLSAEDASKDAKCTDVFGNSEPAVSSAESSEAPSESSPSSILASKADLPDRNESLQSIASRPLAYIANKIVTLNQALEYAEGIVTMGKAILEIPSMAEQTKQQKRDDIKLRKQQAEYEAQIATNRAFLSQLEKIFRKKYISSGHAPPDEVAWHKVIVAYADQYRLGPADVFGDTESAADSR